MVSYLRPFSFKYFYELINSGIQNFYNSFEYLPSCIFELKGLEILLARDNRIKGIDATINGLGALQRLATLDLRNNDIEQVPPILGNLTNIT